MFSAFSSIGNYKSSAIPLPTLTTLVSNPGSQMASGANLTSYLGTTVAISDNGNYIYAASPSSTYSNGTVFYSSNAGSSWSQVSTGMTAGIQAIVCDYTGQYVIVCPWANQAFKISSNYGVSYSTMGGGTFSTSGNNPYQTCCIANNTTTSTIYIGVATFTTVWISSNGGTTFTQISNPYYNAITTNGGTSFTSLDSNFTNGENVDNGSMNASGNVIVLYENAGNTPAIISSNGGSSWSKLGTMYSTLNVALCSSAISPNGKYVVLVKFTGTGSLYLLTYPNTS